MPLKLILRTCDYGYPEVQGQPLSPAQKEFTPNAIHDQRVVSNVQILCNERGLRNAIGCCRDPKMNRVVVIREMSLVSASDLWTLFLAPSVSEVTPTYMGCTCLHLVLVPSAICRATNWNEWNRCKFLGDCRASVLTFDLEAAICKLLHGTARQIPSPQITTTPTFHIHLDIFIDSIVDETRQWASKALCDACELPTFKNTGMKPSTFAHIPIFIAKNDYITNASSSFSFQPNGDVSISNASTSETNETPTKVQEMNGASKMVPELTYESQAPKTPTAVSVAPVTYASVTKSNPSPNGSPDIASPLVLANRTNT